MSEVRKKISGPLTFFTKHPRLRACLIATPICLILYFLSVFPADFANSRGLISPRMDAFLKVFYAPGKWWFNLGGRREIPAQPATPVVGTPANSN